MASCVTMGCKFKAVSGADSGEPPTHSHPDEKLVAGAPTAPSQPPAEKPCGVKRRGREEGPSKSP